MFTHYITAHRDEASLVLGPDDLGVFPPAPR